MSLPSNDLDTDGRLRIIQKDEFVVIDSTPACGLKVGFAGAGLQTVATVVVTPENALQGQGLQGLCGDCDGEADDLKMADGTDVSENPDKDALISDSYVVNEKK